MEVTMKLTVVLSAILVLFALVTSCSDRGTEAVGITSPGQLGKVSLSFAGAPLEVTQVVARLTRSGYTTLVMNLAVSDSTHASGTLNNVAIGLWHLAVEARDSGGVVRYSGETDVNVLGGQTTHVSLQLLPAGGGSIEITVTWGSSPLPTAGLMAYYPFNGNANDASGNAHHGVVNGPVLTAGRFGTVNSAYNFDGANDYIDIPNTNTWNMTTGFTFTAWVNFTEYSDSRAVVAKHVFASGNGHMIMITSNKLSVFVSSEPRIYGPTLYNDGQWHFAVAAYNGTTMYIYVDGVLQNSRTGAYTNTNNADIYIGATSGGGYYVGKIDDVRIYSRPLTLSEIQTLYHEGGW